jgi:hypothetical protein
MAARRSTRKVHRVGGKAHFDDLRAKFLAAHKAARDEAITQSIKYGSERKARSWASRGEKTRLEKLESKRNKIGDAITGYIVQESPRGEAWKSGVPTYYLYEKLSWDDVIKPANEPLSSLPPPAYGWSEDDIRRHLKT